MRMITLTALTLALLTTSVAAQEAGDAGRAGGPGFGGLGGRHHGQKQKKAAIPKPKVDEKAYSAALKEIPDKSYDPWHGVH